MKQSILIISIIWTITFVSLGFACATSEESTRFSFIDNYLGDTSNWLIHHESRWNVVMDEGDFRWGINTTNYHNLSGGRLGEYALIKNRTYGDFIFTAMVKSSDNTTHNPSRDYDVIFGYHTPYNYYYMMFSTNKNNTDLFIVRNGEREFVAGSDIFAVPDSRYHNISIERTGSHIMILFDGQKVLETYDSSFGEGRIGIGSFNDMVLWDDIRVMDTRYRFIDTDMDDRIIFEELYIFLNKWRINEGISLNQLIEAIGLWKNRVYL